MKVNIFSNQASIVETEMQNWFEHTKPKNVISVSSSSFPVIREEAEERKSELSFLSIVIIWE